MEEAEFVLRAGLYQNMNVTGEEGAEGCGGKIQIVDTNLPKGVSSKREARLSSRDKVRSSEGARRRAAARLPRKRHLR